MLLTFLMYMATLVNANRSHLHIHPFYLFDTNRDGQIETIQGDLP